MLSRNNNSQAEPSWQITKLIRLTRHFNFGSCYGDSYRGIEYRPEEEDPMAVGHLGTTVRFEI